MSIDDEDFPARVEELAEKWEDDPEKVKQAWRELLAEGEFEGLEDDVAKALIGEPDTLYARAVRFVNEISQRVSTRIAYMAEEHLKNAEETARENKGEDQYWDRQDREAGL